MGWAQGQGGCKSVGDVEVHLITGQHDPKTDHMSSWPNVVLLLATRSLYLWARGQEMTGWRWGHRGRGYILPQVSLTQRLTKCQADPQWYHLWPPNTSTRR